MNILLFSRILEKTGVGNHINQLSRELARQGHRVMVVSGTKNQDLDNDVAFKHLQTLSKNPLVIFKSIQQLHAIITQNKIDVVHCHHRVAALFMKLYNMLYPHVPTVYTLHSAPIPSDFFHRILTFPGDHTIGVSSDVSQFLTTALGVSSQKVTTVLNGVNQEELFPLSNDEKIALQEKFQLTPDKTVLCTGQYLPVNRYCRSFWRR